MTFNVNFHKKKVYTSNKLCDSIISSYFFPYLSWGIIFLYLISSHTLFFLMALETIGYIVIHMCVYTYTYICVYITIIICYLICKNKNIFTVIYMHRYNLCSIFVKHNKHMCCSTLYMPCLCLPAFMSYRLDVQQIDCLSWCRHPPWELHDVKAHFPQRTSVIKGYVTLQRY